MCGPTTIRETLRAEIDRVNALVYENVNNGVYRAGFATSQEAYEEAFATCSRALDELERATLDASAISAGPSITEADWRLFTTLVRFDAVYYGHFKCNLRRIVDYPNLSNYLRDLYQQPGIAATVNMDHIKRHYYGSQRHVNPSRHRADRPAARFLPRRTIAAGSAVSMGSTTPKVASDYDGEFATCRHR